MSSALFFSVPNLLVFKLSRCRRLGSAMLWSCWWVSAKGVGDEQSLAPFWQVALQPIAWWPSFERRYAQPVADISSQAQIAVLPLSCS